MLRSGQEFLKLDGRVFFMPWSTHLSTSALQQSRVDDSYQHSALGIFLICVSSRDAPLSFTLSFSRQHLTQLLRHTLAKFQLHFGSAFLRLHVGHFDWNCGYFKITHSYLYRQTPVYFYWWLLASILCTFCLLNSQYNSFLWFIQLMTAFSLWARQSF